jgi:hypothetical protein
VKGYRLKSKSKTHRQEDKSLKILSGLIDFDRIDILQHGGVVISIDGEITFLDTNSKRIVITMNGKEILAMAKYQIKSSYSPVKISKSLKIEDITDYVLRPPHRAILFFVNIPLEKVYWEIIDENYVKYVLKIKDLKNPGCDSKTINFRSEKVFDGNSEILFQDFSNPQLRIPSFSGAEEAATEEELKKYKTSLSKLIAEDLEKILILEAMIFFYSPFLLTDNPVFQIILSKAEMSLVEFEFYTNKLVTSGIMTRVGDVLSVTDSKAAQGLLNELINKKGIEYVYG